MGVLALGRGLHIHRIDFGVAADAGAQRQVMRDRLGVGGPDRAAAAIRVHCLQRARGQIPEPRADFVVAVNAERCGRQHGDGRQAENGAAPQDSCPATDRDGDGSGDQKRNGAAAG